jgi:Zn-dependent protease with chaperone function
VYELLGISLVFASLLTINAIASLAAAGCWRFIERFILQPLQLTASTRAEIIFAMRVGPPALALIAVTLLLVPSYIGYEPTSTSEIVSKKLAALAIVSAIGIMLALWRSLRTWFVTRRLLQTWLSGAVKIELKGTHTPTFRIANSFPIIAVVGTFRPRLFIAESVLETLSPEELQAAIAHEGGHLLAYDNFKRSLLRASRDLLMIAPCGRSLDRAWAEAAECAADEQAARQSAETALNLAAALVKIAKMVPVGAHAAIPMAAFLVGVEETRGVKARVGRLLEIASHSYLREVPNPAITRILPTASLVGLILCAAVVANDSSVLISVHDVIERAVALLS